MVLSISLKTYSLKLTMFSIRFPTKTEVLIDITPYGKLMETYGCFHKLKYYCCVASHAFHKVFLRFAPKIEPLINTTDICVSISLNIIIMKLTMFSIRFP